MEIDAILRTVQRIRWDLYRKGIQRSDSRWPKSIECPHDPQTHLFPEILIYGFHMILCKPCHRVVSDYMEELDGLGRKSKISNHC